ncbi:hypothetical protein GCM10027570_20630 [Streptomonospora sediminis]
MDGIPVTCGLIDRGDAGRHDVADCTVHLVPPFPPRCPSGFRGLSLHVSTIRRYRVLRTGAARPQTRGLGTCEQGTSVPPAADRRHDRHEAISMTNAEIRIEVIETSSRGDRSHLATDGEAA